MYVDGGLVNQTMVASGWATAVRYLPDTALAPVLEAAQAAAQASGVGLWSPGGGCAPAPRL